MIARFILVPLHFVQAAVEAVAATKTDGWVSIALWVLVALYVLSVLVLLIAHEERKS